MYEIKERERPYQELYFKGKQGCRKAFCFIYNIENTNVLSIARTLDRNGISPGVHEITGKLLKYAIQYVDIKRIKPFLLKHASDNVLPLPERPHNYKTTKYYYCLLIKALLTYIVHQEYKSFATEMHYRSVSLRTFKSHIQILLSLKPCTDVCQHCQDFADKISKSGNL
jgi:hypothetical protein